MLAIEPILVGLSRSVGSSGDNLLDDLTGQHGFARACADDVAVVVPYLSQLLEIARTFQQAETETGLVLGPAKCVVIPLIHFSTPVERLMKEWLSLNIPQWAEFKVAGQALYLGVPIGPAATCIHAWDSALKK